MYMIMRIVSAIFIPYLLPIIVRCVPAMAKQVPTSRARDVRAAEQKARQPARCSFSHCRDGGGAGPGIERRRHRAGN